VRRNVIADKRDEVTLDNASENLKWTCSDPPTADSVCPLRVRTPPSRARKGTMCPGRVNSCAGAPFASLRAVRARSWADIPVVVPTRVDDVKSGRL